MDKINDAYCRVLGISNPYHSLPHRLAKDFPRLDAAAFRLNPKHAFVYDKLFIAQSQNVPSGELRDLKTSRADLAFPIFIKPRYGHMTSSSKNCYKIARYEQLKPYWDKPDMMWSAFVDATEGMTDFALLDGAIVHQITYVYSDDQYGFADVWKYIDPKTQPPTAVVEWVNKHMNGYTGPFNVQYRADTIIEVGLRFARTGMYLESTGSKPLIDAMNQLWEKKVWTVRNPDELLFRPFYSFKCWSPMPIVYLLPQHIVDFILKVGKAMPFYEYYFEPTGATSTIFFQFLHRDFKQGMRLKTSIERTAIVFNVLILILFLLGLGSAIFYRCYTMLLVSLILLMTSLDNSLTVVATQIKNQRQFFTW
jgi:hypothetical protein